MALDVHSKPTNKTQKLSRNRIDLLRMYKIVRKSYLDQTNKLFPCSSWLRLGLVWRTMQSNEDPSFSLSGDLLLSFRTTPPNEDLHSPAPLLLHFSFRKCLISTTTMVSWWRTLPCVPCMWLLRQPAPHSKNQLPVLLRLEEKNPWSNEGLQLYKNNLLILNLFLL